MPPDIQPGDRVRVGGRVGDVIRVESMGSSTQYTIFFEGERPRPILVPPNTIEKISNPLDQARGGRFDPPWKFELLSQATRLSLAYEHHHLLSLSNSRTDLQPYQVEAVYQILGATRQRFLIADEVGLGKTIEAGMVLKELEARGRAERVLIVTPAPLTDQWRRELREKFGFRVIHYDSSLVSELRKFLSKSENPWNYHQRIVTSMDYVKQDHVLPELEQADPWDVMIFDEAHNLSVTRYGTDVNRTQRYRMADAITPNSDALFLLTATPHKGDNFAFWNLIKLLDPYLFPTVDHLDPDRVADLMIRRIKDNLRDKDGEPVFRPREVEIIPVEYTDEEMALYEAVTRYVAEEFNLARSRDHRTVGFAMIVLQKRMVSSIAAIRKSLARRVRRLLEEREVSLSEQEEADLESLIEEPGTLTEERAEELTERLEQLTLHTGPGLHQEISRLNELHQMAEALETDSKAARLVEFVEGVLEEDPEEKIIIFTEYRDTLDYLYQRLVDAGMAEEQIAQIYGGTSMEERRAQEEYFAQPGVNVLLATDAASEGINLQFCHILVNYELPWNPNRIDQRIGRVHRYGQDRDVRIYNMLVKGTREGYIFNVLQGKIHMIKRQLQGQVTDVLGTFMDGVDLTEIIMDAVSGNTEIEVTEQHLEEAIQERLRTWEQVQSRFLMPLRDFDLDTIQNVIERSDEVTVSNADIEQFVRAYFDAHGGEIENTRYKNIYRLTAPRLLAAYPDVKTKYERVAFQKDDARRFRPDEVDFIAFGHPLLEAIITECRKRDEGFGGAASVRCMPRDIDADDGILFNFILRYTDASGEVLSEDFLPVFVTAQGEVRPEIGQTLIDHPLQVDDAIPADSPSAVEMRDNLDRLHAIAFEYAQDQSQEHGAQVSEKRERDVRIQIEDLNRWRRARSQVHHQRLREYRQRLAEGEDMNVAIRREERLLQDLEEKYEERKANLESQRTVVSQAPELLNLSFVVNKLSEPQ
jgi:superfamily II DNA or RNA helicase